MLKIVIDTNVVISAVFFGGLPRALLEDVVRDHINACASLDIISEYDAVLREMISRKQGHLDPNLLLPFISKLELIIPTSHVSLCRDPDDDKFLSCALDSKANFIVSGDKDLLSLDTFNGIRILSVRDFFLSR